MPEVNEFNAIRISLASPEQVRSWSYGEVTKPETINYRTLKPEKDGLFCERIFGPTKDYECYCGKYKKIRYKGTICDRCGVEVTKSKVRRERMGHIELAAPVSHIWFLKGTPSRLGLLLDLSPRSLERVVYFAQYIITSINTENSNQLLEKLRGNKQQEIETLQHAASETENALLSKLEEEVLELNNRKESEVKAIEEAHSKAAARTKGADRKRELEDKFLLEKEEKLNSFDLEIKRKRDTVHDEIEMIRKKLEEEKEKFEADISLQFDDIDDIRLHKLLTEGRYRELKGKYPDLFEASMGTEAILEILKKTDPSKVRDALITEIRSTSGQRRKKAIKRLRVVEAFRRSGNKPEWMILGILPVLPPDLRPMVQLDGGRFATSDLNDLYRRVINRNNRLKRLLELGAPDIIIRNEKRMLQEAVDSLIDNGRSGRATTGAANRRLKSLSDMLRGKQGRFRQNLLGKRVDYSGRSVIIVGPELQLHQCGLPRRMALELFKPFVMSRLVQLGVATNIKSARRLVERAKPEVWDVLEEVVKSRPVLLNRAPTLHRLSIQAFEPVLIDGSAIQIHPLVCTAFNADFDGDQMAVHLPLSRAAIREAREVMLSIYNMLLPSNGDPIVAPTLDMVLGCYYLTSMLPDTDKPVKYFSSTDEARLAYDLNVVNLRSKIKVKYDGQVLETTVGRIIFNEVLPEKMRFKNEQMDKSSLKKLIGECYNKVGPADTASIANNLKGLGFKFATKSGTTIAANDIEVPKEKAKILEQADEQLALLENKYRRGLTTSDELYTSTVKVWSEATEKITNIISLGLPRYGGIYMMATSGAKGNIAQIRQMAGMRGLMTDPSGRIIELPIRSSFREGLSVLEYFISTHGARKGLADTALRTSDSGYLTRRLIDVAQDTIVFIEDCGTTHGVWITEAREEGMLAPMEERLIGRMAAEPLTVDKTGEVLVAHNEEIDEEKARKIIKAGIKAVHVRSPLGCQARQGICQKCYGRDLARRALVCKGVATGIIAAQSIGEPGTQLTMRTFHTGGVAGGVDITSGLPRVEELFEARSPKGQALISEIDGMVEILQTDEGRKIMVTSSEIYRDQYKLPHNAKAVVNDGDMVAAGAVLAEVAAPEAKSGIEAEKALVPAHQITSQVAGTVAIEGKRIFINYEEKEEREYIVPAAASIKVANGSRVVAGKQLTDGHINPQDILRIMGRDSVQRYLVDEVQKVYRSQGVNINDKHIEVIVRQMLRKVRVDSSGDTNLLPGELVDRFVYEDINAKVLAEGGEPATAQTVLLGITRASLNTDSFLAAASFQETTRVLTEAAISGKIDRLQGLKENVIIGRLVPTRCLPEEPVVEEEPESFFGQSLPPVEDAGLLETTTL